MINNNILTLSVTKKQGDISQITILNSNADVILNSFIRSPSMPESAPTLQELAPKITDVVNEADLIVGYNMNQDLLSLSESGVVFGNKIQFRDIMFGFSKLFGNRSAQQDPENLSTCAEYFGYRIIDEHSSIDCAKAIMFSGICLDERNALTEKCLENLNDYKTSLIKDGNILAAISSAYEISTKEEICMFLPVSKISPETVSYLNKSNNPLNDIYGGFMDSDNFLHISETAIENVCNNLSESISQETDVMFTKMQM